MAKLLTAGAVVDVMVGISDNRDQKCIRLP